MPATKISLETLGELGNGSAAAIINQAINEAVRDFEDRGADDKKPRKVNIELTMALNEGVVIVDVTAKATIPPRRSYATACEVMRTRNDGASLLFQPTNADAADQDTLFDKDGKPRQAE